MELVWLGLESRGIASWQDIRKYFKLNWNSLNTELKPPPPRVLKKEMRNVINFYILCV